LLAEHGHAARQDGPRAAVGVGEAAVEELVATPQETPHIPAGPDGPACRLCGEELRRTFVDLGVSPLANSYLESADLEHPETFHPLHVYVCEECLLVQLPAHATPQEIFSEYAYFSSFSDTWVEHARRYVEDMVSRFGYGAQSFVVEIASNDGYLLQFFAQRGVPVLGIEPAANVAAAAVQRGIATRVEFFGAHVGARVAAEGRPADLIVGNNVLAHVPDPH